MSDEVKSPSMPERDLTTAIDETNVVREQYEWSSTDPATAVIEAVSAVVDRDPTEIEPLYGTIDPDALNSAIRSGADAATTVSFPFAGRRVTVHGTGEIAVRSATQNFE
jgi:hypothetical protein